MSERSASESASPAPSTSTNAAPTRPDGGDRSAFVCHCGKRFNRVENLVRHDKSRQYTSAALACFSQLTHPLKADRDVRPFPCTLCPKSFTRSDLLKRHVQKLHVERGPDGVKLPEYAEDLAKAPTSYPQESPRSRTKRRRDDSTSSASPSLKRPYGEGSNTHHISADSPSEWSHAGAPQPYAESGPTSGPRTPTSFSTSLHQQDNNSGFLHALANVATEHHALHNMAPLPVALPPITPTPAPVPPSNDYQQNFWSILGQEPSPSEPHVDGWGYGMEWLLEDPSSLFDILQPHNAPSEPVPPASADQSLDPSFLNTLLNQVRSMGYGPTADLSQTRRTTSSAESGGHRAILPPSRAATPPIEPGDEDKWPTNWKASGKIPALGAGSRLAELASPLDIEPELTKWSPFWLDEVMYDKVKNSLTLAHLAPGIDVTAFKMPTSLHTVNQFLSLYFENFEPQMPIIHLPTFHIAEASPLLIASLICVGSTFSRLKGAKTFCTELVEVIRKTVNALFEAESSNLRSVNLIHVTLLQCVAGLWSGNKRTFELTEAARGTLVNLCRRADLLNSSGMVRQSRAGQAKDLEERWRRWAAAESRKRLGVCICLVDSVFPSLLDTPSYISQGEMPNLVLPCDERYWSATTAQQWNHSLGLAPIPPSPFFASAVSAILTPHFVPEPEKPAPIDYLNPFASLVLVSALHHHIYEYRAQLGMYLSIGLTVPQYRATGLANDPGAGFEGRRTWLYEALEEWRRYYYNNRVEGPLLQAGRALYHLGHIALAVHIRLLYAAAGKHGPEQAEFSIPELKDWTNHDESIRAVQHSLSLLEVLLAPEAANLHYAPGCAFVAVLCLWCFVKHHQTAVVESSIVRRLNSLLDGPGARLDQLPRPRRILEWGAKFLASSRGWRFGSALALVLLKQIEADGADSALSRASSQ